MIAHLIFAVLAAAAVGIEIYRATGDRHAAIIIAGVLLTMQLRILRVVRERIGGDK